jgi:hypothetical protein
MNEAWSLAQSVSQDSCSPAQSSQPGAPAGTARTVAAFTQTSAQLLSNGSDKEHAEELYNQCCGSVTFWYGSGSADPYHKHRLTAPAPDPAFFVSWRQDANKN